jgi:hypothetical protein
MLKAACFFSITKNEKGRTMTRDFFFFFSLSLKRGQLARSVPFRGKRKGRNICCGNAHTYKKGTSAGLYRMRQNFGPLKNISQRERREYNAPTAYRLYTHKSIGPLKTFSPKESTNKNYKVEDRMNFFNRQSLWTHSIMSYSLLTRAYFCPLSPAVI